MPEWNPDKRLEELAFEQQIDDGDPAKTAMRIFRENAVMAAHSITWMAIHSPDQRIRLDAAKYTVERIIGKVGDEQVFDDDPIESLLRDIVRETGVGA